MQNQFIDVGIFLDYSPRRKYRKTKLDVILVVYT